MGLMFDWIRQLFETEPPPTIILPGEEKMSVVKDVQTVAQTEAASHASIITSIESEVDKIVASANSLSSRTFKDAESFFSVVKAHLISTGKWVEAEAETLISEIRAKL